MIRLHAHVRGRVRGVGCWWGREGKWEGEHNKSESGDDDVTGSWTFVKFWALVIHEGWSIKRPLQCLSVCLFNLKVSLFWFIQAIYLINKIWHIFTSPFCKKGGKISAFPSLDQSIPHGKMDIWRQSAGHRCEPLVLHLRSGILWMNAEISKLKFYASDTFHLICFVCKPSCSKRIRGWGKNGNK